MSAIAACSAGYAAADWRSLAAHRLDPQREEPEAAAWAAALAHLDGCPACRRAALAADPTLVFRRLQSAVPIASESEEIAAVQQAVAGLRSAARFGSSPAGAGRSSFNLSFGPPSAWPRWAAAAVLAVAALAAGSAGPGRPAPAAAPLTAALAPPAPLLAVMPATFRTVAGGPLRPAQMTLRAAQMPLHAAQMPMLEELDRPDARVYQIDGGNLSVVMIVDEGLDV